MAVRRHLVHGQGVLLLADCDVREHESITPLAVGHLPAPVWNVEGSGTIPTAGGRAEGIEQFWVVAALHRLPVAEQPPVGDGLARVGHDRPDGDQLVADGANKVL